jgi:trehalose 6-phosphate synthase
MTQRVVVASNRGPVSYQFADDGSLSARRGGGGMIAGVMSGLAALGPETEATWICAALSEADRAAARQGVPADTGVRMLDIPPEILDRAYNEVANSALWFVHHMLFDTPVEPCFGAAFQRDWRSYVAYNEAFAGALAEAGRARALIQDYHLALAPRMLRDRTPDARIAHFSHTPWAPPAYYRLLPDQVGRAVLDGMLGADHCGFLAAGWADAFLDCCTDILGASVTGNRVTHRGHVTEVGVHPLGIDVPELRARAGQDDVAVHMAALTEATGGRQLIVRVDRTELSKNILRGLAAYRELLISRPQWRGQVVHLAFAYPSRSALPSYRAYTEQVQRFAEQLNAEFGTPDWTPLILEVKDDYARSLAACRLADVLLINPIRDGMNLVAQEGPALSDNGCALVLSREAGSAALFGDDALLVNPYDIGETAGALDQALTLPRDERQRRAAAVTAAADSRAPARWLAEQLDALALPALDRGRDLAEQPQDPPWAGHDQVGLRRHAAGLLAPAGHRAAGDPLAAQGPDRGKGWQVAKIIAAVDVRTGACFTDQSDQRGPLIGVPRAQLDYPSAGLGGQAELGGQGGQRPAEQFQCGIRVGRPPRVHGQRVMLVLDPGARWRVRVAQQAGQGLAGPLDGGRHLRRGDLAVLPAFGAVVAEHHDAGHLGQAAKVDHLRYPPPGDHRQRADRTGEPGQHRDDAGENPGIARIGHDGRERAVEVESDQGLSWLVEQCDEPGPAGR